ncbi:MAG: DUF480 domain-containing protein [Gemmataceae bacterium]|nr:DUF480 domain-containing protein [Gemmata sp.]MDW8197283.1 DUF480 domain-containing protein [Gemmataceae bacterium]
MSTDATSSARSNSVPTAPVTATSPWEPLSVIERRILGTLVEKQKTSKTADAYPLTLNALVIGCNQKSNRDPVMELDEIEVEEALEGLQRRGLVSRITGGRVDRFRHELYQRWTSDGPQLAVLAELLLRGPQTKGDLRLRASRMAPIDSLDQLDEVLQPLLERQLIVYLTEPERRGAVVTHGFHTLEEFTRLKAYHSHTPVSPNSEQGVSPPRSVTSTWESRLTAALSEIDALKTRVAMLESQLADMRKQLALPSAG